MVVVVGERGVDLGRVEIGIGLQDLSLGLAPLMKEHHVHYPHAGIVERGFATAVVGLLHDVRMGDLRQRSHDKIILPRSLPFGVLSN